MKNSNNSDKRKLQQMSNETNVKGDKYVKTKLFPAHLINVSLDPVARWTIKV